MFVISKLEFTLLDLSDDGRGWYTQIHNYEKISANIIAHCGQINLCTTQDVEF